MITDALRCIPLIIHYSYRRGGLAGTWSGFSDMFCRFLSFWSCVQWFHWSQSCWWGYWTYSLSIRCTNCDEHEESEQLFSKNFIWGMSNWPLMQYLHTHTPPFLFWCYILWHADRSIKFSWWCSSDLPEVIRARFHPSKIPPAHAVQCLSDCLPQMALIRLVTLLIEST